MTAISFFRKILGNTADREVKVSRAFAACFAESATFRAVVLRLLWDRCGIAGRQMRTDSWRCDSEVVLPNGRVDLQLTSDDARGPIFRLENKVEATLTGEQLKRYRVRSGNVYVIALTKYPPDVGRHWLEENRCYSIRWQDLHHALGQPAGLRGREAFLCREFRNYLQELGMAHRDQVNQGDLFRLHRFFRAATDDKKYSGMRLRNLFDACSSCLGVLEDVAQESVARQPILESWSRHGPTYFKWRDEDGTKYHHLAFRFEKKNWRHWIGAGFVFPEATEMAVSWHVGAKTPSKPEWEKEYSVRSVCRSDGGLDQAKLVAKFFLGIGNRSEWQ